MNTVAMVPRRLFITPPAPVCAEGLTDAGVGGVDVVALIRAPPGRRSAGR